ncbi:NAD-P-binding protein [Mycena vitilis]|nr:NAD-P-binding protein [Mycena vitilis]
MATTIKQSSLVLVTGANGFIASHVADQLLAAGYNVRGTTRSAEKAKWLYELFEKKYGPGRFAAVSVVDMGSDGAFDEAAKGVDGIVHLATIATFSDKVDEVVPPTVKGALEVLRSAAKEPRVRSVVYTSSSAAVYVPEAGKKTVVTEKSWNETAIAEAHSNPKADRYTVYSASKAEAEQAVWQFVERTKPHFQFSTVIPDMNWGPILQPGGEASSSTASWLINLIRGVNLETILPIPPQWYINVVDTARLHVAALIDPACNGKRIFAFGATYNWNDVLAVLRKQNPGREFIEDVPGLGRDLSEIPNQSAEALLKKHYQKGFTGLEETVRENSRGVV